jgi:hypothetical protein
VTQKHAVSAASRLKIGRMTAGGARGRRLRIPAVRRKVMPMINGLLTLLIIGVILGLIYRAIDWMGLPQPFNKGLKIILVIVGLILLINFLLSLTGHGGFIRI